MMRAQSHPVTYSWSFGSKWGQEEVCFWASRDLVGREILCSDGAHKGGSQLKDRHMQNIITGLIQHHAEILVKAVSELFLRLSTLQSSCSFEYYYIS